MQIKLVELDPDMPVEAHEQGTLRGVSVAQISATLGFANNRFDGEKVQFDWGFTAQIDDTEPVICAVYDWDGSAGESRDPDDDDEEGDLPMEERYFYTFGPDVLFQELFGPAYMPTAQSAAAAAWHAKWAGDNQS
jgi:hypothetical protein